MLDVMLYPVLTLPWAVRELTLHRAALLFSNRNVQNTVIEDSERSRRT
jgi:hypothetical protein